MTAVSKPKRRPPSAPTTVALSRLEFSCIGEWQRELGSWGAYSPLAHSWRQVRVGLEEVVIKVPHTPPCFAKRVRKRLKTKGDAGKKRRKREKERATCREHTTWFAMGSGKCPGK